MSEDVQRKIFKDVSKMYDVIWKVSKFPRRLQS